MGLRLFGYACLGIISAAILATAGTLAWFIADRGLPVEVSETTVLTPVVKPGGKLVIRQRLIYIRNCSAYVDRALFDAHTHRAILPPVRYERPPQGLASAPSPSRSRCRRSSSREKVSITRPQNTPATRCRGTTGRSRGRRTWCGSRSTGSRDIPCRRLLVVPDHGISAYGSDLNSSPIHVYHDGDVGIEPGHLLDGDELCRCAAFKVMNLTGHSTLFPKFDAVSHTRVMAVSDMATKGERPHAPSEVTIGPITTFACEAPEEVVRAPCVERGARAREREHCMNMRRVIYPMTGKRAFIASVRPRYSKAPSEE